MQGDEQLCIFIHINFTLIVNHILKHPALTFNNCRSAVEQRRQERTWSRKRSEVGRGVREREGCGGARRVVRRGGRARLSERGSGWGGRARAGRGGARLLARHGGAGYAKRSGAGRAREHSPGRAGLGKARSQAGRRRGAGGAGERALRQSRMELAGGVWASEV